MSLFPKLKNDSFITVSATGTVNGVYDVQFVDASAGNITLTLPAASSLLLGRNLIFKRIDLSGNTVTVQRAGADTIDGLTSLTVDNNSTVVIMNVSLTAWRSFNLAGSVDSSTFTTVSATGSVDGSFDVYYVDATAGNVTITLPLGTAIAVGRSFTFKRIDNTFNTVTVQRAGADTIDGGTSVPVEVTDIVGVMTVSTTAWRSFRYEGAVGAMTFATVTGTGAVDGAADLYIVNVAGAATVTLPAASSVVPGRRLQFRRIDTTNNAVTITRAGADTIQLTNAASATSTTLGVSDSLILVRTGATAWSQANERAGIQSIIVIADAIATVNTNYKVWVGANLTANRAFTLPAANSVEAGRAITIFASNAGANNVAVTPTGADLLNGVNAAFNQPTNVGRTWVSDGNNNWFGY